MKQYQTYYQANLHNQIFPLTETELQMHFVVNIWIGHVSVRRTAEDLLR